MTNRLLFFAISLLFPAIFNAEVPSLQRDISVKEAAPQSVIKITLHVTIPEFNTEIPTAWILQETWPKECVIRNATWNGAEYPPFKRESDECWIFGYPDMPWIVENGTLSYELLLPVLPENETQREIQAYGKVYTCDDENDVLGNSTIFLDIDAPFYETIPLEMKISPGWNLLSAPCVLSPKERESLLQGGHIYGCAVNALPSDMSFCHGEFPETPGTPFWYHEDGAINRVIPLSACDPIASELFPNGGEWHDGWNLVGVSGNNAQTVDSAQGLWLWQNGRYTKSNQNTLYPGQAGWIFR